MSDKVSPSQPPNTHEAETSAFPKARELIIGGLIGVIGAAIINALTRNPLLSVLLPVAILVAFIEFSEDIVSKIMATIPHKHKTLMRKRRRTVVLLVLLLLCAMIAIVAQTGIGAETSHSVAVPPSDSPSSCTHGQYCILTQAITNGLSSQDPIAPKLEADLTSMFMNDRTTVVPGPGFVNGYSAALNEAKRLGADLLIATQYEDAKNTRDSGGTVYMYQLAEPLMAQRLKLANQFVQSLTPNPSAPVTFAGRLDNASSVASFVASIGVGFWRYTNGQYVASAQIFGDAAEQQPPPSLNGVRAQAEAYSLQALSNLAAGHLSSALIGAHKAIVKMGKQVPLALYEDLSVAYLAKGEPLTAIDVLAPLVPSATNIIPCSVLQHSYPLDGNAYYVLGLSYHNLNQLFLANNMFTNALCINAKDEEAYYYRGDSREIVSDRLFEDPGASVTWRNGAHQDFNKAASLNPKDPAPHVKLGEILENQGDTQASIAEYQKAVDRYKALGDKSHADEINMDIGRLKHPRPGSAGSVSCTTTPQGDLNCTSS